MFRPLTSRSARPRPRRGVILIVVLSLLALFAVVGLSFVFFADSEANASRIHRESISRTESGQPDPTEVVNRFLGSFLFDTFDNQTGANDLQNALRGHSLMATMYGRQTGEAVPFRGVGTFHEPLLFNGPLYPAPYNDRVYNVNYTMMTVGGGNVVLIDPEWTGGRQWNPGPPASFPPAPTLASPGGRTYIPKSAPYTYPDHNNFFLGTLSPTTGEVLVPSFYRSWSWNPNNPDPNTKLGSPSIYGPNNQDWYTSEGRARTLRPRPVDNLTQAELTSIGLWPLPLTLSAAQQNALNNLIDQKIASGDLIPYPPANAPDSPTAPTTYTYTGDVQNLWGGVGVQKNDSLLMDVGLPARQWNGRLIKPLVAALIVDLDGRLNVNAHDNLRGSYAGYGPWEVSLTPILGAEAGNVVGARYGPNPAPPPPSPVAYSRNTNTRLYDPTGGRLPAYSVVNWDGSGFMNTINLPSGVNQFQTVPSYSGSYDDNVGAGPPPASAMNHPGLYNPTEWPSANFGSRSRTFPATDLKRMNARYADRLSVFQGMDLAPYTPTSLVLTTGANNTPNQYRIDLSHANRLSLTHLSASLDRPELMPNYANLQAGLALQLSPTFPFLPQSPGTFPGPFPFPTPGAIGPISDFAVIPPLPLPAGGTDMRHQKAGLGPVDLNRPLADYRMDTTTPLSTLNVGNTVAAWNDRHNLARDVFARLIVATGAAAYVDPSNGNIYLPQPGMMGVYVVTTPTGPVPVSDPEYNALRYLAQLAANIVDYIDNDDISTAFVWNPPGGVLLQLPQPGMPGISDPSVWAAGFGPSELSLRMVFGVEKPKLVINEAYSEVADQPGTSTMGMMPPPPGTNVHVRFWVELLNPTSNPYTVPGAGPQGTGAVTLRDAAGLNPYRLQICRNNRGGGVTATGNLQQATNTTGDLGFAPEIQYNFLPTNAPVPPTVAPNNGMYAAGGVPANGVVLVGPSIPGPGMGSTPDAIEFNPAQPVMMVIPPPWNNMIQAPAPVGPSLQDAMGYTIPMAGGLMAPPVDATYLQGPTLKQHVVVLQRLANPYLAFNPSTNPYVTVDYLNGVASFDSVIRASGDTMNRTPRSGMNPTGYEPMPNRFAIGKVQPHAGLSAPVLGVPPAYPTYTYPNSFVLRQAPAPPPPPTEPQHTFGRHNGTSPVAPVGPVSPPPGGANTIVAPYDWFVHFDRPLGNQLELLQVHAGKPHEVAQLFAWPNGITPRKDMGLAPWFGVIPPPVLGGQTLPGYDGTNLTHNGLFRALEVLRVKPWGYGVGLGGRVHGRINLNTVQDVRVLRGLMNQSGNPNFPGGYADSLWTGPGGMAAPPGFITNPAGFPVSGSRTPNSVNKYQADGSTSWTVPMPGPTVDDLPTGGTDRPFKSFGVGEFQADPGIPLIGQTAYASRAGSGLQDTLLRLGGATPPNPAWSQPAPQPQLWLQAGAAGQHPYFQAEPARKILNSVTTVSHTFAVYMTVVYFEVRRDTNGNPMSVQEGPLGRYLLGKEAYREVPGDLRQPFFAVVDRSMAGLAPGTSNFYTGRPFFTNVEQIVVPAPGSATATLTLAGAAPFYPPPPAVPQPPLPPNQIVLISDGQPAYIGLGTLLVLGVGAQQDVVTVTGFDTAGNVQVSGLTHVHTAGECVSNIQPGNPGPQPGFDVMGNSNSSYKYVVPYLTRLR